MPAEARRALFLDRDGVVNLDIGYLHRPADCVFVDGIFELARRADRAGYVLIVVTNQAGIARGYYSEAIFAGFTDWMLRRFEAEQAPITHVYHCPHHPTAGQGAYRLACACRKPAPGMLLAARDAYRLDIPRSAMIGDAATDMAAAAAAGVGTRLLLGAAEAPDQPGFTRIASHAEAIARLSI
ncbi:D-glycero-alpha-D-manno-heptose-1,7-bisphosphate 7-phosphatase [Burkholderia gladioli]|uniref:D-glycero-alpha-D-manno-heptose-1,7-bisphosphate 7-phosphatase n=1 Tax=Burkholderia gladioli TaxID=28095 RepID=UPI000649D0BE|nr:HAD family hydrolase [Burkholderia gladioli]